ncbi:MAG: hypothetical protein WCB27_14635 [Thermoguttaceae bacterium]
MDLHLTQTEEWVLRYAQYLDENSSRSTIPGVSVDWTLEIDPIGTPRAPQTYVELERAAELLAEHDLLRLCYDSSGLSITMTGSGVAYLRSIDNPDYIEKWKRQARSHPWVAATILAFTFLGSLAGWASLLWNIFGPRK